MRNRTRDINSPTLREKDENYSSLFEVKLESFHCQNLILTVIANNFRWPHDGINLTWTYGFTKTLCVPSRKFQKRLAVKIVQVKFPISSDPYVI